MAHLSASIGFAVYPFSPLNPGLVHWEQVSTIADQCAYVAKQSGRNAWVGVYGGRDFTADDVELLKTDLAAAVERRVVGIRTSVYGELRLSERGRKKAQ